MKNKAVWIIFLILFSELSFSYGVENFSAQVAEKKVGFFSELNKQINLNVPLTNTKGEEVLLSNVLNPDRPTIIVPLYYDCPRLCGLLLNGFLELLKDIQLSVGKDFQIAAISFDPSEGWELARDKAKNVYESITRKDFDTQNFHFFVGKEEPVKRFFDDIGFRYEKDGEEYAHSSGIIILTPQGQISQYFTGIEFSPWDVRLSLADASQGKVGSTIDHILLFCYRFDPTKGKYTLAAFNSARIGILVSIFLCIIFVVYNSRKRSLKICQ